MTTVEINPTPVVEVEVVEEEIVSVNLVAGTPQVVEVEYPAITAQVMPRQVTLNLLATPKASVGTWTFALVPGLTWGNAWTLNSPSVDGDLLDFDVLLEPGTWTLDVFAFRSNNSGNMQVLLDGVQVASHDLYAAANVAVRLTTTGIVVGGSGPATYTLHFKVNGKNIASVAHFMLLTMATFTRTS